MVFVFFVCINGININSFCECRNLGHREKQCER